MREDVERKKWPTFLEGFGERNKARLTRLEVINKTGGFETDFWLEDGLPLMGVSLYTDGEDGPLVGIMLDEGMSHGARHLTHAIARVRRVGHEADDAARDTALEVEDERGNVSILRFE